jgi:hypothetical protein
MTDILQDMTDILQVSTLILHHLQKQITRYFSPQERRTTVRTNQISQSAHLNSSRLFSVSPVGYRLLPSNRPRQIPSGSPFMIVILHSKLYNLIGNRASFKNPRSNKTNFIRCSAPTSRETAPKFGKTAFICVPPHNLTDCAP